MSRPRTIRTTRPRPGIPRERRCRGPVVRRRRVRRPTPLLASLLLSSLLLSMAGCVPLTAEIEAPVEPPPAFSASGVVEPPERWWTAFGDPALDRLVDRSLTGNLGLAEVWERLREARAVADREASDLYPDVDAFADGSVFRSSGEEDGFGGGFGADGGPGDGGSGGGDFQDEDLRLGLAATYEIDLWGRIRSRVEAERLRARATLEDYRTAALSLSAEVARTWFQWIEAREQLALLDEQVEANRQILQLLENRFANGQIRGVDVLRQRQLVEATRERRIEAEARAAVLEHLLAVLLGRSPQGFDAAAMTATDPAAPVGTAPVEAKPVETEPVDARPGGPPPAAVPFASPAGTEAAPGRDPDTAPALPPLPPLPVTGLPAELVRRRPDVRAAWLRVEAADRDLAAAIARRYPRLTLGAGGDLDALDLFDAWTRSLTADLLAPLFRAGELEADAERAAAVRRQVVLRYGQATLEAFREVEDALVREARQVERMESLERQVELTEQALERLRMQYLNGLGDYIDVLTALTGAQQVRRDLLTARRELLERRVALYRALAGGFATHRERPPEAGAGARPDAVPPAAGEAVRKPAGDRDVEGNVNDSISTGPVPGRPAGPARRRAAPDEVSRAAPAPVSAAAPRPVRAFGSRGPALALASTAVPVPLPMASPVPVRARASGGRLLPPPAAPASAPGVEADSVLAAVPVPPRAPSTLLRRPSHDPPRELP